MVDFDLILDVAVICDAVACDTAHGAVREAGCEGQSRAREKGARGGGVSEEVEGQGRRITRPTRPTRPTRANPVTPPITTIKISYSSATALKPP